MDLHYKDTTDTIDNDIDNITSQEKTSSYLDNGESLVKQEENKNTDRDNEYIRIEESVVRRRKTDRKRASVRTKLWRKSMMERSVLPPPPLPPDPSQPAPSDNNTTLSDNNGACPQKIPGVNEVTDDSVLSLSSQKSPRDDTRVSPSNHQDFKITLSDTLTSPKDTDMAKLAEKLTKSRTDQEISPPPVSPLDNKQPPSISSENKWMRRKQLSVIKRQSLPPPPVPPNSTC
ncbi:hypothetical protein LOTGIDRAFT_170178 [Lottia gigantea]|uniref:Uncharacterized protein n=1 Tax=Lottia gigantea TaxID=225164 RepID=V3ZIU7_LOTGI|nr:hypothetical protein LOTGIDRAFT_170178 [Lottia gigantea]ESO82260.1 hypothetical protein LOTGIDRAFT_170178 [Lottia gigantea]